MVLLLHPKSRGFVRLNSSDPLDPPLIDPKYLSEEEDVKTLIRGLRLLARLYAAPAMRHLQPRLLNISLPGCTFPPSDTSDGYLECVARGFTQTFYHASGTCRMGSPTSDAAAVVDPELRVIGMQGLRVVDASVFPTMPSGNPQATVYAVAERAAVLIKSTHQ